MAWVYDFTVCIFGINCLIFFNSLTPPPSSHDKSCVGTPIKGILLSDGVYLSIGNIFRGIAKRRRLMRQCYFWYTHRQQKPIYLGRKEGKASTSGHPMRWLICSDFFEVCVKDYELCERLALLLLWWHSRVNCYPSSLKWSRSAVSLTHLQLFPVL